MRFSMLVDLVYDAALEPARWSAFLRAFAAAVGADGAALMHHDLRDARGAVDQSFGIDPDGLRRYAERFATVDPWLGAAEARGQLQPEIVHIGEELVPHSELVRTEFYADFAKPIGTTRSMSTVLRRDADVAASLSALRPDSREPFSERNRRVVRGLLPHVQRALRVHRRLAGLELMKQSLGAALDRVPSGVVLVDRNGTLAFANRAAETTLRRNDGLAVVRGRLTAADRHDDATLLRLIWTAAERHVEASDRGGALRVSRPSMRRPLSVLVVPVRRDAARDMWTSGELVAVFVNDPDRRLAGDPDLMRTVWRLTPTEATIATLLVAGHGVPAIANRLAIALPTVRWHIKNILAKTGAKNQAALVALLAATPEAHGATD